MKKFFAITLSAILTLAFVSCKDKHKADDPLADTGRTQRTENLLTNMKALSEKGYMYGHQDDTMYGVGWCGDADRSDIKSVCNDYPAVMGFDLGNIELGDTVNLDGVSFNRMRQEIIKQYDRGAVITLSWHVNNPLTGGNAWVEGGEKAEQEATTVKNVLEGGSKHEVFVAWLDKVCQFLNSLETPYGVKVPVIFRPWHEHTGSWFWWGQNLCSTDEYKALWQLTKDRIKENEVTNALLAYSPGGEFGTDEAKYLERYPGDETIDILGVDTYCYAEEPVDSAALTAFTQSVDQLLGTVCSIAKKHGKLAVLSETGFEGIKTEDWWTATLEPALDKHQIGYVLTWRNAHDKPGHFYGPYPGQLSVKDFVRFYNSDKTFFAHDVNGLYLKNDKK